jgi:molybdopterin converting factor small subunit
MGESNIAVRLFAGLERQAEAEPAERPASAGDAERQVPVAEAPTVRALLVALGLEGRAGLVLVNGVHAGLEHEFRAGDEVDLFPPVGGG